MKFNRNKKSEIEDIFVTLDTHDPDHIAHAKFWRSPEQCEPTPFQQISHEDVTHGTWTPSNESLRVGHGFLFAVVLGLLQHKL